MGSEMDWLLSVLIPLLLLLLHHWSTSNHKYWASFNVPSVSFLQELIDTLSFTFNLRSPGQIEKKRYQYLQNSPFGASGGFLAKDPELIQQICITDFQYFYNRGIEIDTKLNPLGKHLFFLEDSTWKTLRNKISPAFSSAKLKIMHTHLSESSEKLVDQLSTFEKEGKPFEAKSSTSNFSLDFIATSAFGLTLNAITDSNSEFLRMVQNIFKPSFIAGKIRILLSFFPKLGTLLKFKIVPQETEDFFMNLIKDTIQYREKNNIKRNDMFQLMMDIRENDQKNSDTELVFDEAVMAANCFVFFLGGFDTVSVPTSMLLYEVAYNMDIQDKLYQEIQEKTGKYGGEISYEALKEMTYLDQVVAETLRKYPPLLITTRKAKENYNIRNTKAVIPKGTVVRIPIYAIQNDPKYFPNPDKFDPDRFDGKKEIVKGTYLPFGEGPRMCIASRLAQQEIKTAVSKILKNFKVTVDGKTPNPIKFATDSNSWEVAGGLWLKVARRKEY